MARAERPVKYPVTMNIRISEKMRDDLTAFAALCGVDRTDIVRDAIETHLALAPTAEDASLLTRARQARAQAQK